MDIFQHSPFGDMLSSLKSLSLSGDSRPNYLQLEWEVDDEEIRSPPTAHFIGTVEDLIDTLDYDSEDIDGMEDDAGEEEAQNPPFTGRWTATSSYDVYMVDAPKDNSGDDKENLVEDDPPKTQQKRPRQRRRSKSRRSRDSNTGTGDDNTPDGAEDIKTTMNKLPNRTIRRMGKSALTNRP